MREAIVNPTPELHTIIHEVPIPDPGPDEVVIKVIVAGSNPKDWDHLTTINKSLNSGDDIAGTVHSFGTNVQKTNEFKIGDRVAAFHPMMAPHGAFAEYAVAPQHTVLKIPDGVSFEEAATIPLVTTTAAISLFRRQYLPAPWAPRVSTAPPIPLIIYGASSSVGTFAIKLALASNIHPIIAISGGSSSHLTPLLDESKGDALVDYRNGTEKMKQMVKEKLNGLEAHHALDAISSKGTWVPLSQMLSPSTEKETTYLSVVSGANKYDEEELGKGVQMVYTYCGTVHSGAYLPGMPKQGHIEEVKSDPEFGYLLFRYLARMIADGRFSGHPFEVVDGGLDGVGKGLNMLKEGKARGNKFVFKIGQK